MNKIELIKIEDIDLNSSSVIEASAGTGKTHTIVGLTAEIILRGEARLDEILIVTFTEKATGELKERIRSRFIELAGTGKNERTAETVESLDKLFVSTIHGFCNRMLDEYSFENRESFERDLEDDANLAEKIVLEVLRHDWEEHYAECLPPVIGFSSYTNRPGNFINIAYDLVLNYKPYNGDDLRPVPLPVGKIKNLLDEFDNCLEELKNAAGPMDDHKDENCTHWIIAEYNMLDINGGKKKARIKNILVPLLDFIVMAHNDSQCGRGCREFYEASSKTGCHDLDNGGFLTLFDSFNKASADYDYKTKNPDLYNVALCLNRLLPVYLQLKDELLAYTVDRASQKLAVFKIENSLISYDDMLKNLKLSVGANPEFLKILQERFKFALIDEFQDTDPAQWEIFRKIFLENEQGRLFVIGDPKQSIYGFRNADINTYLRAKNTIINDYGGKLYYLGTCWRSSEKLVSDFNKFFKSAPWFEKNGRLEIEYDEVRPAFKNGSGTYMKTNDDEDMSGIFYFNLESTAKEQAMRELGGLIAFEAASLVNNKNNISIRIKDKPERALNESDICILVRDRDDADKMQSYLTGVNVKSMIYKKTKLFATDEAANLGYIINAALNTEDANAYKKALLSDFFNVEINEIDSCLELDPSHPVRLLFDKWQSLARRRDWPLFFHSILHDTGLVYRLAFDEKGRGVDSERAITNYRHITEKLIGTAGSGKFDIFDLAMHYSALVNGNAGSRFDEDLHRLETEENKVVIMTIHASKGLEFPVVFDYSILGKKNSYDYYKFHENDTVVFDISCNKENKEAQKEEEEDENIRLKYVAFTRAMMRLYLCRYEPNNTASKSVTTDLTNGSLSAGFNEVAPAQSEVSVLKNSLETGGCNPLFPGRYDLSCTFAEIKKESFINRRLTLQSFSAIGRFAKLTESRMHSAASFTESEKDHGEVKNETASEVENELPGGTNVGLMFHKIFEEIDFGIAGRYKKGDYKKMAEEPALSEIVDRCFDVYMRVHLGRRENEPAYKDTIYKIIHKTLNTEIMEGFTLSDITEKLQEAEFYFPLDMRAVNDDAKNIDLEAQINGFIDMVFRHEGRYYLVDWKSNILEDGYSGESFSGKVMEHYKLQYDIYYAALIRWLKTRIKDFDYEKHFGGIYYIYLRGIGTDSTRPEAGIHHVRYGADELGKIENALTGIIGTMNESR